MTESRKDKSSIMKILQFLFEKIVAPLLVVVLTPVLIGIVSQVKTGNWTIWFVLIPKIFWTIFVVVILLWVIIIIIVKRVRQLQKLNAGPLILASFNPVFGWIDVGELRYAGVVWKIHAPATDAFGSFNPSRISPSYIEVETPPRCPKCKTELEQIHSFWSRYIWRCVACGFQKRNRDSYYREEERVTKIARREWEKRIHES